MSESFTAERWREVWSGLTERERKKLRNIAKWDHVSLSAALRSTRPDLWEQLTTEPRT